MTDHPMLFSEGMVRALLDRRKTQTRRLLTPGTTLFNGGSWTKHHKAQEWAWNAAWVDDGPSPAENEGPYLKLPWKAGDAATYRDTVHRVYPRMQRSDRIWVKETHAVVECENSIHGDQVTLYHADGLLLDNGETWRPSIHMRRADSRITLRVREVRIERLQDISRGDCMAEGCPHPNMKDGPNPRDWFRELWDKLNAERAPWASNPWVIAHTFLVFKDNIDEVLP